MTSERILRNPWVLFIALVVWVLVGFAPAWRAEFVMLDDNLYAMHPYVLGGITPDNLRWAWTETHLGYWIPLTYTSLQIDGTLTRWIFGPGAEQIVQGAPLPRATVFHVHNVLLHALAAGLLFASVLRMTGRRHAAWVLAGLWAVHPLRVESVLWVTERKDVLAGVFGFLTLYLYIGWQSRGGWIRYTAMSAAYLCSLLAKPTLFMTLPVLLMLLDYWPLQRLHGWKELRERFNEKWSLWFMTIGLAGLSVYTQQQMASVMTLDQLPADVRFQTVTISYLRYPLLHVVCGRLGVWYPYPDPAGMGWTLLASLVLAGITAACWFFRRKYPWLWVGWAWYVLAFLHLIGIVQTGLQGWADRFTYIPAIGLVWMAIWAVPARWWRLRATWGVVAVIAVALTGMTIRQACYWRDSFTLFERTLDVAGESALIQNRLEAARQQGQPQ